MKGTVYLTDGFERLDLPGRECVFALEYDWAIRGQICSWVWPYKDNVTVAGAEIVTRGRAGEDVTWIVGVEGLGGPPFVARYYDRIEATPAIVIAPSASAS